LADDQPVSLKDILGEEEFAQLLAAGAFDIKPFRSAAIYFPAMDMLYILSRNASTTGQYIPETSIELLWDSHDSKQLAGVAIHAFSSFVPKEVIKVMTGTGMILQGAPTSA
jgi:hypothetical protein